MKNIVKALMFMVLALIYNQSQSQNFTILFVDNFETGGPNTVFGTNTGGGAGTNMWTINDEFDGMGLYPNTPSQNVTIGGIGQVGSPDGMYMHINDITGVAANSNYNASAASERWAISSGYCTLGFSRVVFNFWWHANGSPADQGEVYYSIDGGAWVLATNTDGLTSYGNANAWTFSSIEDPIFLEQGDLRFAFKWKNDGNNTNDVHPFSVDDVMLIAYYDDPPTATINSLNFSPSPLCHEYPGTVTLLIEFTGPLCAPATYFIEMSDGNGNWANSTVFAYFELDASWSGFTGAVNLTGTLPLNTGYPIDSCYKFRINRTTPPVIFGTEFTGCIEIIDCPDSTVADQFVASMASPGLTQNPGNMPGMPPGQQPVCINSLISVPFYSYGAFNPGNNYILQLSDSSGSFVNPTDIGGPMPDTRTYDPALPYMPPPPGSVSGTVPEVPEGCNYYVRVISTDPVVHNDPLSPDTAVPWGPFCIKECDILTNDMQPISVCVTNTDSACVPLSIDINSFDTNITYQPGNQFLVQLLAMGPPIGAPMQVMNESYWTYDGTESMNVELCVPILPDYLGIPLQLGTYYMRIVASNSSADTNVLGSLIFFTVSGVSGDPLTIALSPDSVFCGDNSSITFSVQGNFNPSSTFAWFLDGQQLNIDVPNISLNVQNLPNGVYEMTVQETSPNGDTSCVGPMSAPAYFYVNMLPPVQIFGPHEVCVGDTSVYTIDFDPNTYYEWSLTNSNGVGDILYQANNQLSIVWTGAGTPNINIFACNICDNQIDGCSENSISVLVKPTAQINGSSDTTICEGETLELFVTNEVWPVGNEFVWVGYGDTVQYTFLPVGDTDTLVTTPSQTITYYVKVDHGCPNYDTIVVTVVEKPDIQTINANLCLGESTQLDAQTDGASSYSWTPPDGLSSTAISNPMATPTITTDYVVTVVYDSICPDQMDTISVQVNAIVVDAGQDVQIYTGDFVVLNATGGSTYSWTPDYELTSTTIANPIATPTTTTTYYVTVTDEFGCVDIDSITIEVLSPGFEPSVPDAFTPDGNGPSENDKLYVYDVVGTEGDAVEAISFRIYNRWGELIFEALERSEIIYPNGGWDGTHMKSGKEMEVGVYVWVLEATTVRGETYGPISGNVTLLK